MTKIERKMEQLHRAYLEVPWKSRDDYPVTPSLRTLARRFGVPFKEADRSATLDHWELERDAHSGREWHARCGYGARTEDEFVVLFAVDRYRHLIVAHGRTGYDLAVAYARDVWRRCMSRAFEWDAVCELERAREAYDAAEARRLKVAA